MNYEIVPPAASAMLESLRGVGYSIETAIADLVDNSLAAGAGSVWIRFEFKGHESWLSVLDDGRGMDESELRQAMVMGGRGPQSPRQASDLGRFGLGLKTASFSQCRSLTVSSKKAGNLSTRRWDLDFIAKSAVNDWRLLTEAAAGAEAALSDLDSVSTGTMVLWQRMDRITGRTDGSQERAEELFLVMLDRVRRHLAMVFHRFLGGPAPQLRIFMGMSQREPARIHGWDPFLSASPATESSPLEPISTDTGLVELQGFVLPHRDLLTQAEYESAAGPEGWTSQQGFYVYRNRRMLVGGEWLGLGVPRMWTKEEPFKLARLRLDFDSSADEAWTIDIKKSVARPPRNLVSKLTALADHIRARARQVFAHRGAHGTRAPVNDLVRSWLAFPGTSGTRYRINRKHPVIQAATENRNPFAVEQALSLVEQTVPVQRIWLDALEQVETPPAAEASDEIRAVATSLLQHFVLRVGLSTEEAKRRLLTIEPFHAYPDVIAELSLEPTSPDQ